MTRAPAPNSCSSSTSATNADAPFDCLIVGAGPAGLTAATYLQRFHRRVLVVDAGASRARWIPTSHNCPGFPLGVSGDTLLQRLRAQAEAFGVERVEGRIEQLQCDDDGFLARAGDGRSWRAAHVILATGIVDAMPPVDGLEDAIANGAVRLCAICDGFEASDDRLAVYGPTNAAIDHALFLRTFSRRVAALPSDADAADAEHVERAQSGGVPLRAAPVALRHREGVCEVDYGDGSSETFDSLYAVLGGHAQSDLACALGADCDADGCLHVDAHQQTSVDGLYAIGDVVSALNQISVAVGQAALAACHVHNRLPRNYREADTQSEAQPSERRAGRDPPYARSRSRRHRDM